MLLAIDIGNTNIHLAIFKKDRIIKSLTYPVSKDNSAALKDLCAKNKITDCAIASVVPFACRKVQKTVKQATGKEPYIAGKNLKVPMPNLYLKPATLGQDRLLSAFAASLIYGAPVIVISLGTAITIDAVSKNKEYLGGLILPGVEIALESLHNNTALLPGVKTRKPTRLIARDTESGILSGVIIGYAGLCDEMSRKIKAKIGKRAKTIATGGNAALIKNYSKEICSIDLKLTLKGLNLAYNYRLRKALS